MIVLGSGMAALGAHEVLYNAGIDHVLFDKNPYPGGHTATFYDSSGFIFDDAPHISFTENSRLQEMLARNVGGEFETIHASVDNYWHGYWIKHPAQVNLHGLPEDLVVDCIADFVAAAMAEPGGINNYEQWLKAAFGRTFAETFPMVYGLKYHTTVASNMSTDWLGPRLYQPDLRQVLRGALSPNTAHVHYVDHFRYPTYGGFVNYLNPWLRRAGLRLNHEASSIDPEEKVVNFANGNSARYAVLLSSIPLPDLVPMIRGVPDDVRDAAARLACTTAVMVNLGIARDDISSAHWRYFYDEDIFFTRLSFPHLFSPKTVPEGHGSIQAECYYSEKYRPLDRTPESCIEPVIADLERTGILTEDDKVVFKQAKVVRYSNVIFDLERHDALAVVHGFLQDVGIRWCGRYGDWDYSWTDQAFFSGENAALTLLEGE